MKKLFQEEFHIPGDAMVQVSSIICEKGLHHVITEVDEDEEIITVELEYIKDDREVIHEIEDLIYDYMNDDDDDEYEDDE